MNNYDDIILLNHKEPNYKHPRMPLDKRSAQFSPFAALTGFGENISEKGRIIERKIELDESKKNEISETIIMISNQENKNIKVRYFLKDKYIEVNEVLKKVDVINKTIICVSKRIIPIENIFEISLIK